MHAWTRPHLLLILRGGLISRVLAVLPRLASKSCTSLAPVLKALLSSKLLGKLGRKRCKLILHAGCVGLVSVIALVTIARGETGKSWGRIALPAHTHNQKYALHMRV